MDSTVMEEDAAAMMQAFSDDVLRAFVLQSLDKTGTAVANFRRKQSIADFESRHCRPDGAFLPESVQLTFCRNSISDLSGISEKLEILDCSNTTPREPNLTDFFG
ncbi:MAG: hypothetical protein ACLSFT_06675 [Ruminococcus callidus]